MSFINLLSDRWKKSFVCVGLDPVLKKLPHVITTKYSQTEDQLYEFNKAIIDATAEFVCAYKPQVAYYEAEGAIGYRALIKTIGYIKKTYPDIPVILDAKRADIGSTNEAYCKAAFDVLGVDAITVNPYLGKEAMQPFLDRKDKGIIVLVKTSNPGAGEFQDLLINDEPFYQVVAQHISQQWNTNGNCCVVVGAPYPQELKQVRQIVGEMPILIPGIGMQGGDIAATVKGAKNAKNLGMIINSSRGIIYASTGENFAETARLETQKLRDAIFANL